MAAHLDGDPIPDLAQEPSFLDSPLRVAGIAVLVDALIPGLCAFAFGPAGFLVRTGFDVWIGLSLLKGNEGFRNWAMIRHRVMFKSHVLKEPIAGSYLKVGMCFATETIVSWTTSCASTSVMPACRATP